MQVQDPLPKTGSTPLPSFATHSADTIEPNQAAETEQAGEPVERCEKCTAPSEGFAVCRACGYYAKLGEFVEIDHEMEGFEVEKEVEPFRLPQWSFGMIIGPVSIIAESVSLAMILPLGTIERLVVSILHMLAGIGILGFVHSRATFLAMMDDTEVSMMDCLANPFKAWSAIFRHLPETKNITILFVAAWICMFSSLVILRAIPYHALFEDEWGKSEPLRSVIVEKMLAQGGEEAELPEEIELTSAIEDFADQGAAGAGAGEGTGELGDEIEEELNDAREPPTLTARCIVIGFKQSDGEPPKVRSLVVATKNRNPLSDAKWEVLGSVQVSDEDLAQKLLARLIPQQTKKAFVESHYEANWVKPKIRCEVTYQEEDDEEKSPRNVILTKIW